MLTLKQTGDGLAFSVYVQPRASKTAIVGTHQGALKIRLTAPPVGGAANKQLIQVLSKALGIPKSTITIKAGQTSRTKHLHIAAEPPESQQSKALRKKLIQMCTN